MTTATTSRPGTLAGSRTRHCGGFVGLAWLTWRQHRWMIAVGVLGFGLLTAYLLWLDQEIGRLAATCGGPCSHGAASYELWMYVNRADSVLTTLMFAGPVVAAFLAAPLVSREYEQRTNLLVWSQDVRAPRWLAAKAVVLATVAAALSAVLGFAANTLTDRIHAINVYYSLFLWRPFQATPAMLVAYTLFGFALGLAISAVVRRTVVAMGVTLLVFIATRVLVVMVRPFFLPPFRHLTDVYGYRYRDLGDNALVVNSGYADTAGNTVPYPIVCNNPAPLPHGAPRPPDFFQSCMRDHGIVSYYVDYQPGSRIGTFQLIEEGIFLGLAAVLLVLAWWRVRRATTVG